MTTAGWRIEPQKTRGKTANRAARVFIADFYSGNIARVHSSVRFHFSEIQSYYSLFLQFYAFTSHPSTYEECTPVRFLFARLRVFSVNSAQTIPSQRIFSVNPGKSAQMAIHLIEDTRPSVKKQWTGTLHFLLTH